MCFTGAKSVRTGSQTCLNFCLTKNPIICTHLARKQKEQNTAYFIFEKNGKAGKQPPQEAGEAATGTRRASRQERGRTYSPNLDVREIFSTFLPQMKIIFAQVSHLTGSM